MFRRFIKAPIKFYTLAISPLLRPSCRYYPTCSCYTQQAIDRHGVLKGLVLGLGRICRCHPLSKRPADDPVPEQFKWRIDLARLIRYKRET